MIEFVVRGKKAVSGEWVIGHLFFASGVETVAIVDFDMNVHSIDIDTIGVCVDCSAKDRVFSGDIVECKVCDVGELRETTAEVLFTLANGTLFRDLNISASYRLRNVITMQVVGNIYDDLVKKE